MINYVKELCSLNGISGREESVREYILSKLPDNARAETDPLGNLIVFVTGEKRAEKRVMLASHMDEVGLLITFVTEEGYLKFSSVGKIDTGVILGKSVFVGEKGLCGVIGVKPVHKLKEEEKNKMPPEEELYIDIGAKSRNEALEHVRPGDKAWLDSSPVEFGEGLLKARALDDRVGCALLLNLINSGPEYDFYAVFTVQEEVGARGAATAAFSVEPEYAIVLEATTAADIAGVSEEKQACALGGGAAVSFMDRGTLYDRSLFERVMDIAKSNNIKTQVKTLVAGGNDAQTIHASRRGVKVITISLPCRYLHSPSCVISLSDIEPAAALVSAVTRSLACD